MNPTAIYSKSGKGVQEASGKTSLLKRGDRAVLSAIDGRATLADVAQKVGKSFDADFQKLVTQMDKDGFIREVSSGGAAPARSAGPAAKAPPRAAAPAAPMDAASDLDFSSIAPAPKPAAKAPPPKEQQTALNKAREEAEAKAAADRDRIKAETEAKVRAELESKARAETEAKMKVEGELKAKADSEAKVKAARDAVVRTAAEAKVKAEAEARRVREEADKAKRESADLKQRLEEERKAREEAERKARDEGERGRKELEEERKRLEEKERKDEEERAARRKREEEEEKARRRQREEEERKADEERAARRKAEEEEEKARRKKKEEERKREEEEEERRAEEERAARRKKREEEEALARATEEEERRIRAEEAEAERQRRAAQEDDHRKSQAQKSIAEMGTKPAAPAKPAAGGGGFDSLLADLDSFGKKDEGEAKAKEEAERKAEQDAARRAEEAARQEREEEERRASEERAARRKREAEEEDRKAEEERAARRKKREDEERREAEEREAEEKKRREKEEAAEAKKSKGKKARASDDDIPVSDDDLDMDDVKRDQRALAGKKKKEKAYVAPPPVAPSARRRPTNWGKPVAIGLILLLAATVGAVHVLPLLPLAEYERAASEAIGRPVKIASGRMWLFSGLQLKLQGVTVGDNVKIANVTAYPTLDTLSGEKKTFNRIDLDGMVLPQEALAEALFARVKGDKFTVARVVVKQLELTGPVPLPKGLEADIALDADGALRTITVRGPDTLVAKLTPKDSAIEFEVNAGGFPIPIAPEVTLGKFAMKGRATRQGMAVSEWDGALLNGTLRGTANLRWGSTWSVNGVMTARGMNAAVFAPALVSGGRGEGTAKFSMSGTDPAKLGSSGRFDGSFRIEAGALGNVDLSRAIRTGGRETAGRTEFSDMTGQAIYERGAVTLRNIQLSKGALNAGASADISREGALSGRIVADVKAGAQTLRATLILSGTAKDPQFRN